MTQLSATQAAKLYGVSTHTITRAIKAGKLSADRQGNGYTLQLAELIRLYGEPKSKGLTQPVTADGIPSLSPEQWQARYEDMKVVSFREREQLQDTIDDLRKRLDNAEMDRRATQARLESIYNKKSIGIFQRIKQFGKI